MAEDVVRLHFLSHLDGVGDCFLDNRWLQVIGEETFHLLFTLDVFGPGVAKSFLVADQLAGQNAKQGVMGLNVLLAEVVGIVCRHQFDSKFTGDFDDLDVDNPIFRRAMILDLKIEILSKDVLIPTRHITRNFRPTAKNRLWDLPSQTSRRHD